MSITSPEYCHLNSRDQHLTYFDVSPSSTTECIAAFPLRLLDVVSCQVGRSPGELRERPPALKAVRLVPDLEIAMNKPNSAEQLRDAGFRQSTPGTYLVRDQNGVESVYRGANDTILPRMILEPSLSQLIEACGEEFEAIDRFQSASNGCLWHAQSYGKIRADLQGERCDSACCGMQGHGSSPEEAVARLWLELKKDGRL